MKFIQRRLQYYLAIVVVLSIAMPALFTGAFVMHKNYTRSVDFDARISAQNYIDVLQGGLSLALWNLAPELAKPIVDSLQLDESVLAIYVVYKNGDIFLDYHRWPKEIIDNEKNKITTQGDIFYQGQEVGYVVLHYGLQKSLSKAKEESLILVQMLSLQLFISFVVLSFVLNKRVLKPLIKLKAAAQGIASGDLKTNIPSVVDDEFGELSKQLELMRSSLERHVMLLELRVSQRTRDQEKLNMALTESVDQVKMAQKKLVQQEKLAALGGLVAGISHELNTPVGNALMVATSLTASAVEIEEKMKAGITRTALDQFIASVGEGAKMIEYNLTRAAELVAGFKQTSIDQTTAKRRNFDLKKIIAETILTLKPNFKNKEITINNNVDADILLDSFPGPLSQIITNLVNNSVLHGFDTTGSGEITISNLRVYEANDKGWVELLVKDSGKGIAPEIQKKIFDPFFTTKFGSGGNGLGMHIVHNLVTGALGGDITLKSELGKGVEFSICIPLVAPPLKNVDGEIG
ncbi:MAG: HAMP domain-containing sensor histidine kinase [Marinagarivorans sp.]|nr:HAMP domain-containing sensor histidine kinase [Marinagarivorans sp.]